MTKIQPSKMYKHFVRLSAKSNGGAKQFIADLELNSICDARFKYCKLAADMNRTPMLLSETELWTLKTAIELVAPETVSSVAELDSLKALKNQKLVIQGEAEWGSDKKQNINFRVQV